jgi:class 3 adenylate cyclase
MQRDTVPLDLVDKITREKVDFDEGGEYKKISAMFVDVRGFSHLLERHEARRVLRLLDLYFRMLVSIIRRHDGIIDKFMGDGLLAVWGLPAGKKHDSYAAARAAIDIRLGMFRIIPELVRLGEVPLEIGVGIGTGPALVGFVGPGDRRDFTLLGNCVNRAARLQAAAADNAIYIDGDTANELRPYSYLSRLTKEELPVGLRNQNICDLEAMYEFSREYESVRKHPRVVVAKRAGVTNIKTGARRPVLIKSIGEGGMGIEIHESPEFSLKVGDETVFDSSALRMIDVSDLRGQVVRKQVLKGEGVYKVKTWDVGIKFAGIPEGVRSSLLKISSGATVLRDILGETPR